MNNTDFGKRLSALRHLKKLKKKDITAFIASRQDKKFTERAYESYESGYRYPGAQTLILLAELYGVSIDYLCGRTDDTTRYTPTTKRTTFARRSYDLRKGLNMTQSDVALIQGKEETAGSRVSLQEQGKHIPRCPVLVKMADYYNIPMDYLLGITDIRRRHKKDREKEVV